LGSAPVNSSASTIPPQQHWQGGHKQWCKRPLDVVFHHMRVVDLYIMLKTCFDQLHPEDATTAAPAAASSPLFWECTSIGCGFASVEYALLVHHQQQVGRRAYLRFHLIDPDQRSFQPLHSDGSSQQLTLPCLTRQWNTLMDIFSSGDKELCDRLQQVLCVFWPDLSGYDIQAAVSLQPAFVLSLADFFGAAGSKAWHHCLGSMWQGRNKSPYNLAAAISDELDTSVVPPVATITEDASAMDDGESDDVGPANAQERHGLAMIQRSIPKGLDYRQIWFYEVMQRGCLAGVQTPIMHGILANIFARTDVLADLNPEWLQHLQEQSHVCDEFSAWSRKRVAHNNATYLKELSAAHPAAAEATRAHALEYR